MGGKIQVCGSYVDAQLWKRGSPKQEIGGKIIKERRRRRKNRTRRRKQNYIFGRNKGEKKSCWPVIKKEGILGKKRRTERIGYRV